MTRLGFGIVAVLALGALAGCIKSKDEYTLNPDGSGKVVHEITQPLLQNINLGGDDEDAGAPADARARRRTTNRKPRVRHQRCGADRRQRQLDL